ncbi:M48 family metalloprotease [Sphingoaurantiacus capsulatus]|uniref:M48 family metalloprotease n=1 Tax=Sphingoaurantiacus capsulatus TaxID=1771310 RepID=A0ABV7XAK5_9SPHN
MTYLRLFLLLIATFAFGVRPVLAQSVLRDAETEAFFNDMSRPLVDAAKLDPKSVHFILVNDPSLNAFVAGGQNVFMHSGTIAQAKGVNQIEGIIAHELGHITGGHNVRFADGISGANSVSLLSLLLGAAAIAVGAGEAGMGIMAGGQQAALGKFLAYSRNQESSTDQAGASFLDKAGISGKGSIDFFKQIQNQEYRYAIPQDDSYGRTHPLSGERITMLEELYKKSAAWDRPSNPEMEKRFQRIKGKLVGFVSEPARTFQLYPETDTSEPARYARAYAWHKSAFPDRAATEVDALLAKAPNDPYYLELKGQILLESGRVKEAIPPLRLAVKMAPDQPLISTLLGHALISTEEKADTEEAKNILRSAVARDNTNPFAWYQLGIAYEREGDEPRAALASAERYNLMRAPQMALPSARRALAGLKTGTPDWLRAQDIVMVSEADMEKKKRR